MKGLLWLLGIMLASAAIIGAYRLSTAEWNTLTAQTDRLNQEYRCLIANGRSLRGATTTACANLWRDFGRTP